MPGSTISDADCPLCGATQASRNAVPVHIRLRCPVAAQIRVFELGLAPVGHGEPATNQAVPPKDAETGRFYPEEASADA